MKIVHVVSSLVKGGGERALVDLANWQVAQGHSVSVVAGWRVPEELLRCDLDAAITVEYVGCGGMTRYLQALVWVWRRGSWLAENQILHAHLTYGAVIATLVYLMRALGWPGPKAIVETYHAVGMPIPRSLRWLHSQLLKRRDAAVFMAEDSYWRRFREQRPWPRSAVILNGLAPPKCVSRYDAPVAEYLRSQNMRRGALIVGTIGRLVNERRPEKLIAVFGKIAAQRVCDVEFLFIGDGPAKEALQRLAGDLHIDQLCHFPGAALDPAIPLALIDLYITVNVGSVTGLAGVHAAMCGVPTIGVQLDATHLALDDDWIWSSNDLAAVATEAIRLLLNEPARVSLAAKQRAHAREKLNVAKMGEAYLNLYSVLLSG